MEEKLHDMYHVTILDPKTEKAIVEEEFQTLEEVLGFLHQFEGTKNRERILACLMGLRDGTCGVEFKLEAFGHGTKRILRIKPTKTFHRLFWEGYEKSEK